jgi:hypothetical protein
MACSAGCLHDRFAVAFGQVRLSARAGRDRNRRRNDYDGNFSCSSDDARSSARFKDPARSPVLR